MIKAFIVASVLLLAGCASVPNEPIVKYGNYVCPQAPIEKTCGEFPKIELMPDGTVWVSELQISYIRAAQLDACKTEVINAWIDQWNYCKDALTDVQGFSLGNQ